MSGVIVTVSAKVAMGAATTFSSVGTLGITGVLSDTGSPLSLTKVGAGILLLGGVNTYTGGTTIAAGTLNITTISAVGGAANSLGQPAASNSAIVFSGAEDFDGGYLNPTVNGAGFQTLVTNFNHSVLPITGFN